MRNTQSSGFKPIEWLAKGPFAPHIDAYKQHLTDRGYVAADLAMKEKVLAKLEAPDTTIRRFKAPDLLMRFLQTL